MAQDKFADAVPFLQRVVIIRPINAKTHHMLGQAFFAQRRYSDAANSFKNALDIESNNIQYRIDFQRALDANPDRARAYFEIGNSYFDLSNFAEALKYYREAVQLDERNPEYQARVRSAEITIQMQEIYRSPTQRDSYSAPTQIDSYRSPTRIEDYRNP